MFELPSMELLGGFACFPWIVTLGHHVLTFKWRLPGAGLPSVTKKDIEEYFGSHGAGKITEIKLMNGFGFIEYEDAMDARDVVPGMYFPSLDLD
jgi:hypothetical protein